MSALLGTSSPDKKVTASGDKYKHLLFETGTAIARYVKSLTSENVLISKWTSSIVVNG